MNLEDEEIVSFLQETVDGSINISNKKSHKTDYNTNILLGPGPSLEVIAKAMEVLDFKKTSKMFFEDKKLYTQLHRPLTPEKVDKADENVEKEPNFKKTDETKSQSVSKIPKDTVKAAVTGLNKQKTNSNINVSSGLTPAIVRHKEHFK